MLERNDMISLFNCTKYYISIKIIELYCVYNCVIIKYMI